MIALKRWSLRQVWLYTTSYKPPYLKQHHINFAKSVRASFLQNICGRLLLFRLKCKLKLWLQIKWICTPLLTNLLIWNNTTATTTENFTENEQWVSTVHLPHIKIDCSFVKQVINGTCVKAFTWRWAVGEMNYFEMLDWFPFSPEKNF